MKECINCKALLEDDELFCHECGTKQEIKEEKKKTEESNASEVKSCIHCGEKIEADSTFCPFCGKPQETEGVKADEPQSNKSEKEETQNDESAKEESPKEEPKVEEPKTEEPKTEESQPEEESTYEEEEEKKSKKWLWILILFLLVGGGVWYYMNDSGSSSNDQANIEIDSVSVVNNIQEEESNDVAEEEITNAEDLIKKMYEEFFEPYNIDRFEKEFLSKYFSESAMSKFYVENFYTGKYFYCTDFLIDGGISGGGKPDYGDKVVTRTIEDKGDGWYEVTNIWDVIKKPVRVRLKVDNIGSKFFISDFEIIKNEDDSIEVKEEGADEAATAENKENEM